MCEAASFSFERTLGSFTAPGSPPGSAPNANDWRATDFGRLPRGGSRREPDTLYMRFRLEGVNRAERIVVMSRALQYLLRD